MPPPASSQQFPPTTNPNVIYSGPYSDPGYLQMALGAYLTPSSSVYKSVDPYFLSQGSNKSYKKSGDIFFQTWSMKTLSFSNPCFFLKLVENVALKNLIEISIFTSILQQVCSAEQIFSQGADVLLISLLVLEWT